MRFEPLANQPFDRLAIQEPDDETDEEDTGDEEIKEVLAHRHLHAVATRVGRLGQSNTDSKAD